MNKFNAELLQQLKSAAQEEIMCREASDTSDAWQDLASPENILLLLEIALPILEQQERGCTKCNGTGEMDSGGTQPWGEQILIECDCKFERQEQGEGDWLHWNGEMALPPVGVHVMVEVKLRNGVTVIPRQAQHFAWRNSPVKSGFDIIAYRIIPERATNQNGEQ